MCIIVQVMRIPFYISFILLCLAPVGLSAQKRLVLYNEHGLHILRAAENTPVTVVDTRGRHYQDYLRIINDTQIMLKYHVIHIDSIAKIKRVGESSVGGLIMAVGISEIALGLACIKTYDADKDDAHAGFSLAMGTIFISIGSITEVAGYHFAAFRKVHKGRRLIIEKY